jgi:hypothetical protein
MEFELPVNDVDLSVHVVVLLVAPRIWHTFVASVVCDGSKRLKPAMRPASCEIVTVWPPIVSVPLREPPPFGATVMITDPLPVIVPLGAVRNDALLTVVHEQLEGAVPLIVTLSPPLLALTLVVESTTAHPFGASTVAALCVNATAVPLTTMLADRAAPLFAAML